MAVINKKLIHINTKDTFIEQNTAGNIKDSSIVFIKETNEIYTHGESYNFVGWSYLTLTEPSIPNNEIWYTSSDGNIVTPRYTDVFGANITSNTYSNGKGVITFNGDVTSIGDYAFYYCTSLTSVTIGDGVMKIGDGAFFWCHSLTSVNIPESVTTIGDLAFERCISLKDVYCKATTPPALGGNYVFNDNASDRKIYVPMESVEAYRGATNWSNYADAIEGYNFS
jgi:hypothetical protein